MSRELMRRATAEVGGQLTDDLARADAAPGPEAETRQQARGRELLRAWLLRERQVALERGDPRLSGADEEELARAVQDRLFGLAGFQPHLDDARVDNLFALGCDNVWVEHADRGMVQVGPVADSDDDLVALVLRIAAREGLSERQFSTAHPILKVTLRDLSRLHAIMEVCRRPTVTIRRHRLLDVTLDQLVSDFRLMTWEQRDLFEAALRAKKAVVIAGDPGSGKSTLARSAQWTIPRTWRIVTLEEVLELHWDLVHPLCTALEVREPNLQGEGGIGMRQLLRQALQMRPDVIVCGELLGDEVSVLMLVMTAGTAGTLTTLHSQSPEDALQRLMTLLAVSPERLGEEASARMVADAVDLVVHIETTVDRQTGRRTHRWVDSIHEVTGTYRSPVGVGVATNELIRVDADGRQEFPAPMSAGLKHGLTRVGYDVATYRWASWARGAAG